MKVQVKTGTPCSANWDAMAVEPRGRFCAECARTVYNFDEMPQAEVERILTESQGRVCARLQQRPDGSILTRDGWSANGRVQTRILREAVVSQLPSWRGTARARGAIRVAGAALTAWLSASPAMPAEANPRTSAGLVRIAGTAQSPTAGKPKQEARGLALEVVDASGATVANANVTIVNEKTKSKVMGTTDAQGQFRANALVAGEYGVTVVMPGFRTLERSHVAVPMADVLRLQIEIGFVGEVVSVPVPTEERDTSGTLAPPKDFVGEVAADHKPNMFKRFFAKMRRIF